MKKLKKLLYRWIEKRFLADCSNYNTLSVRKSCRSKAQARRAFAEHGIPHSPGMLFMNPLKAHLFAARHGFPVVIKPDVSGFSRGSHFPITNYRELWKAALMVKFWWPVSVIEKYLEGKNYRVLVAQGKVISIIRRYPPFVDGDGTTTIGGLITRENETRQGMELMPVMHPIPKDKRVVRYLRKKGMTLETVPRAGQRVRLFNKIALAPGGVVETLDIKSIPDENKDLFRRILSAFNANILGIDAIFSKGIETSYRDQECIFLEVNSRPYLKMHDFPRYGQKQDLSSLYEELDRLQISDSDIF